MNLILPILTQLHVTLGMQSRQKKKRRTNYCRFHFPSQVGVEAVILQPQYQRTLFKTTEQLPIK